MTDGAGEAGAAGFAGGAGGMPADDDFAGSGGIAAGAAFAAGMDGAPAEDACFCGGLGSEDVGECAMSGLLLLCDKGAHDGIGDADSALLDGHLGVFVHQQGTEHLFALTAAEQAVGA